MRTRKLFCAAAVVSLALSIPAFGGDMQTPTIAPPPPQPTRPEAATPEVPGEIGQPGASVSSTESSCDLYIELLLGLLTLY
jgi:hypothetical protein